MEQKHWMQNAVKKPGSFTAQAEKRGETAQEFAQQVKANPEQYSEKTDKRANLAATFAREGEKNEPEKEHRERHEENKEHPQEAERRLKSEKEPEREGRVNRKHPMADWLKEPRRERRKREEGKS